MHKPPCVPCTEAEFIVVAIIRWFEGSVSWVGSADELWRQIRNFLVIPWGDVDHMAVLLQACQRRHTILAAARIEATFRPRERHISLIRKPVPNIAPAIVGRAEALLKAKEEAHD